MSDPILANAEAMDREFNTKTLIKDPTAGMDAELQAKIAEARAEGKQVLIIDPDTLTKGHPAAKTLADALAMGAMGIDPRSGRDVKHIVESQTFDHVYENEFTGEKVDPRDFFISCGPGEIEGRYYGTVMRPARDEEIETRGEWIIVATERGPGHATDFEAKSAAAQRYPTLPVLMGADTYVYPCWKSYDRKQRILRATQERRERRGLTHIPNHYTKLNKGSGGIKIGPPHQRRRK